MADYNGQTLRAIDPGGEVSTIAGLAGSAASTDGNRASARLFFPGAVSVTPEGDLLVTSHVDQTVRRVDRQGNVTTIAGKSLRKGAVDGTDTEARLQLPGESPRPPTEAFSSATPGITPCGAPARRSPVCRVSPRTPGGTDQRGTSAGETGTPRGPPGG